MLKIGSTINGYKVLHKIGSGGMSNVYLVINEKANKEWALKEVKKQGVDEDKEVRIQRLIAETSILKHLSHPRLPSIIDVIDMDETYLILMDYIEGITLRQKLTEEGPQDQDDVVGWALQICEVFDYLHSQDPPIIYRDTKPANIMLQPNGEIVVIDFGTAREYKEKNTEDTNWLGTRGYAAPEQFGNQGQTDERTDIYNLGATMYHLLTDHNPCKPPYEIKPITEWGSDLSSGLEKIILKCTEDDPDKRYQTVDELRYDLKHYHELEDEYIEDAKRKKILMLIAAGMAAVSLFAGVALLRYSSSLTNNNYDAYVRTAQSALTTDEMARSYEEAILLSPEVPTAYEELLDKAYLADDVFSKEEADELTRIFKETAPGSDRSNEEIFSATGEPFAEYAYQVGLAYFYYYESDGNKQLSQPWFTRAIEAGLKNEKRLLRAERLAKVAGYYQNLSRRDKAGDNEDIYSQYWDDLVTLTDGDIVSTDNVRTALVMYRELVSQINMHTLEFKSAGISESELRQQLEKIQSRVSYDIKPIASEEDRIAADDILDLTEQADVAIDITFSGTAAEREGADGRVDETD